MNELRAADLRFTTVEIQEFLLQNLGVDLSHDDITYLEMYTEVNLVYGHDWQNQ